MNNEDFKSRERTIEGLKLESEELDQRSKTEEKKALIREYKHKYGRDWGRYFRWAKSLRVDKETMEDLHGMGGGGSDLRERSRPPRRF